MLPLDDDGRMTRRRFRSLMSLLRSRGGQLTRVANCARFTLRNFSYPDYNAKRFRTPEGAAQSPCEA